MVAREGKPGALGLHQKGDEMETTSKEVFFDRDSLIVSKTNLKGHLTYMNDVFLDVAGYREQELVGKPHNVIRHPDMPRCVFKLLWDQLQQGKEVFAYVVNLTKAGTTTGSLPMSRRALMRTVPSLAITPRGVCLMRMW